MILPNLALLNTTEKIGATMTCRLSAKGSNYFQPPTLSLLRSSLVVGCSASSSLLFGRYCSLILVNWFHQHGAGQQFFSCSRNLSPNAFALFCRYSMSGFLKLE
ncbi:hypothetical protein O9993_06720 [Vibrio lentus]|nr:hypothetical protein [Vibrio lentus]